MNKAKEEIGENSAYLFPEIDNLDFEADLDKAFEEIEALHREKNDDESLEKAITTEDIATAKRRGLVPQSGDWQKPKRWVRPKDADVPVDAGKKPRKKASEDLVISSETKEAMMSVFGDDFDISNFQDMYSIGLDGFSTEISHLDGKARVKPTINSQGVRYWRGVMGDTFDPPPDANISSIDIHVEIHFEINGDSPVGFMMRTFSRDRLGDLSVYHSRFQIDESFQGQGIATDINEHVEEEYEKLGVSRITLFANANIGGYAWAIQGYDFDVPDGTGENGYEDIKDRFMSEFTDTVQVEGLDIDIDSALSEIEGFEHAWEFASFNPDDRPYGEHLGKELMLGTRWNAFKSLNRSSFSYKRGKIYYALKRRENEQTS